jgi:hypothetical protein
MSLDSVFFLCKPEDLLEVFPGWLPPLPRPVRRTFKHAFTGEWVTAETRVPGEDDPRFDGARWRKLVSGITREVKRKTKGHGANPDDHDAFLLPQIRVRPHWGTCDVDHLDVARIAAACGVDAAAPGGRPAVQSGGFTKGLR